MAATKGLGAGTVVRLIGWLAVPRGVTFPILLLLGLGLAELAWLFVDSTRMLAWVSGMASPFCMLCATAVWAMRNRIDDVVDTEMMSSDEYQRLEQLAAQHRTRSTSWAAATAFMALLASAPAVSNQLVGPIWHWMILACGAGVGVAIYAYLLANYWETQIRAYRSQQKLISKQRRERAQLLQEMRAGSGTLSGSGWIEGPTLSSPTRHHH